jgi:hypothetical protein
LFQIVHIYIISKMSKIFNVSFKSSTMWIMQIMNTENLTNIEIPVYLIFTNTVKPALKGTSI